VFFLNNFYLKIYIFFIFNINISKLLEKLKIPSIKYFLKQKKKKTLKNTKKHKQEHFKKEKKKE
jgi:hypothetical protein